MFKGPDGTFRTLAGERPAARRQRLPVPPNCSAMLRGPLPTRYGRWLRVLTRRRVTALFGVIALAFVVLAGLAAWRNLTGPIRWRIAVGPADSPETRVVQAFGKALSETGAPVRLRVMVQKDEGTAAGDLENQSADIAVVRPDLALPADGLTLAVLREEALAVLVPEGAEIDDVADLGGKTIAILPEDAGIDQLVRLLVSRASQGGTEPTFVTVAEGELEERLRNKQADAVAFFAPPGGRLRRPLLRAAARGFGSTPTLLPVAEADVLPAIDPRYAQITLPAGSLSAQPKLPDEEVHTVGVTWRLMAGPRLDRGPVATLLEQMFQLRTRVARVAPAVQRMKAPENDVSTSAPLPNHPGAVDYFNRETQTFMDRYGDWIWIALFAGGGLSSAFAWIGQLFARKRRELVDQVLDRVLCILSEARGAKTVAEIDDLAMEIDGLVTHAVRHARKRTTGTKTMGALMLAIDSARAAIADRRRDILDDAAAPRAPRLAPAPRSGTG